METILAALEALKEIIVVLLLLLGLGALLEWAGVPVREFFLR